VWQQAVAFSPLPLFEPPLFVSSFVPPSCQPTSVSVFELPFSQPSFASWAWAFLSWRELHGVAYITLN
jgi:hypothetical protein